MNLNELEHVLFWREREQAELAVIAMKEKHGYSEAFSAALNAWRKEQIPHKEAFLARIEDYEKHGNPDQILIRCDAEAIPDSLEYATKASGEKRVAMFEDAMSRWAFHLEDYAAAVNAPGHQAILELCTGAGLGTWAVLKNMPGHSTLHSTDFDFPCTQNAIGIAKALGMEDRVAAVCANNWYLPFYDNLFDTICTHYGLDESREVPAVLAETVRVLKPGGRFVVLARMDPWTRETSLLELFGVTQAECREIKRRARLYSGPEDLTADAQTCGLSLISRKDYTPGHGHHRVLLTFAKAT